MCSSYHIIISLFLNTLMVSKCIFSWSFHCFVLGTARYWRRRALIIHSVLKIVEDGGQQYCTPYWKLWKTEVMNTALRTAHCERWTAGILYYVTKILKDGVKWYCTPYSTSWESVLHLRSNVRKICKSYFHLRSTVIQRM